MNHLTLLLALLFQETSNSRFSTAIEGVKHPDLSKFLVIAAILFIIGVAGVLILLSGAVFAGQGLGYIPGSFMTGDFHWFWIGAVMVVIGLALSGVAFLRRSVR